MFYCLIPRVKEPNMGRVKEVEKIRKIREVEGIQKIKKIKEIIVEIK